MLVHMAPTTQSAPPVARLWLAVVAGYLAFGATLQALPGWVHTQFGGGSATAGLAVGIAFAATAICRPFAGRAGDAAGRGLSCWPGGILIAVGAVGQLLAPHVVVLLVARWSWAPGRRRCSRRRCHGPVGYRGGATWPCRGVGLSMWVVWPPARWSHSLRHL